MYVRRRVMVGVVAAALSWAGVGCGSTRPPAVSSRTASGTTAHRGSPASTVASTTTTVPPPTTVPPTTLPPPPPTTRAPVAIVAGAGIAIGDSVLEDVRLYAPSTLSAHNISINSAVGRQWSVGIGILSAMRSSGKLPPVVIVGLGSNGRITSAQFDQMMQACAGAKRVVFMTVTGPLIGNNPIIAAGVARYPQDALADWNTLSAAHPDWFGPDHVHVGPAGATALGNLLASVS